MKALLFLAIQQAIQQQLLTADTRRQLDRIVAATVDDKSTLRRDLLLKSMTTDVKEHQANVFASAVVCTPPAKPNKTFLSRLGLNFSLSSSPVL